MQTNIYIQRYKLMLIFQKNQEREQYQGPPRQGHSFTYCSQLNCSILFGGTRDSDIHIYDHSRKSWSCRSMANSKKQPKSVKFHAAAFLQSLNGLVVSGGRNQHGHSLDDVFFLSVKDWKWKKVLMDKLPIPRQKHALLPLSKSQLLLFGGVSMPYNQICNDLWLLRSQSPSKLQSRNQLQNISCSPMPTKGQNPQGICLAQATVLINDRLYCGCERKDRPGQMDLFCLELRGRVWKRLDLKFIAGEMRFYKVLAMGRDEGVVLWTGETGGSHSEGKCYIFNHSTGSASPIDLGWSLPQVDSVTNSGSLSQTICLTRGKRIFTASFTLQSQPLNPPPSIVEPPSASIQSYLIAIKHEQLLSTQLSKKNTLLEQLYKQMQNYITKLNKQYIKFDQIDNNVEVEKEKHIEDCRGLKVQYQKLNKAHDKVVGCIRELRGELSAINQEFQRCIETEFDEEAE